MGWPAATLNSALGCRRGICSRKWQPKELDSVKLRALDPTAGTFPSCLHPLLLLCAERCQQPQWDWRLHFTPEQRFYKFNEEVTLSCFVEDPPPLAVIRCANGTSPGWKDAWEVKDMQGTWHVVAESLTCTTGKWESSRSPLLHALLPQEGPWASCRICETPWPQLRDGPQLGAASKVGRDRSLQWGQKWGRFSHCPCVSSQSIPELQVGGAGSCPSIHLSPSVLYHHFAQAQAPLLHLGALGFPGGVEH